MSIFSIPTADNDGISAMGWDQDDEPDPDPKPDLNSLIDNAKSQKELTDLYVKHKPTDDKIIQKFKTKKGELN